MTDWIYYANVKYGNKTANNSIKIVQAALNSAQGSRLTVDGFYGNVTKSAYVKWQNHCGFYGRDADGVPGPSSMNKLAAAAHFTVVYPGQNPPVAPKPTPPPTPTPTPTPAPSDVVTAANYETAPEPPQDMTHVTWGGHTVNKRTAILLDRAESILGGKYNLQLTQGSYNAGGVAASAGTHDGGGAGDVDVSPYTAAQQLEIVQGLRKAGFAAWRRTPAEGFAYHIHFEAIGDAQLSSGAASQVQDYFNGVSGLVSELRVTDALHWPNWADKYNN